MEGDNKRGKGEKKEGREGERERERESVTVFLLTRLDTSIAVYYIE